MIYDDDIDVFLDTDDFAEDSIYAERNEYGMVQATASVPVIFDSPGSIVTIGRVTMPIVKPQIRLRTSIVPNASKNDTFTVGGIEYKVAQPPQPDGTGMSVIVLAEDKR